MIQECMAHSASSVFLWGKAASDCLKNRTLLINILILSCESLFLFYPLIAIKTEILDICYFMHKEQGISIRAIPVPGFGLFLGVKLIQAVLGIRSSVNARLSWMLMVLSDRVTNSLAEVTLSCYGWTFWNNKGHAGSSIITYLLKFITLSEKVNSKP